VALADDTLRIERRSKTLRELALDKLRAAILDLRFRPGERLVERVLCEQLGVSRSVVREALRHLEAEGLVETVPHQGPAVARLDPAKVAEIYEVRALLEALAARACAERATTADIAELEDSLKGIEAALAAGDPRANLAATGRFYEVLFRGGGKTVAWETVQSLNARINRLRALTIATAGRSKGSIAEMRRIYRAVAKRDPAEAHAAALDHVRVAAEIARRLLAEAGETDGGTGALAGR